MKQIGTGQIADNAVTGSKIAGTDKLIFGACIGSLPALAPGGSGSISCLEPNAAFGDEIVSSWSNLRTSPAPVLLNSIPDNNVVSFGFENPSGVSTSPQDNIRISYYVFTIESIGGTSF